MIFYSEQVDILYIPAISDSGIGRMAREERVHEWTTVHVSNVPLDTHRKAISSPIYRFNNYDNMHYSGLVRPY